MKLLLTLVFFIVVAPSASVHAQFLDLTIPSGTLPSDVSTWEDAPGLIRIVLAAPDGITLDHAHIVFEAREGSEHVLVSTRNKFADQPAITGTFKKKNFGMGDVANMSATEVDPSIRDTSSVGKLPAGFFGICFYLVDSSGQTIADISQGCTNFFVKDIDAPVLLAPANESTVAAGPTLSFSWTPAKVTSQTVHYQIKIYPIFEGQTPSQAMSGSSAFYTSDDIFSTTFSYPSDAPQLTSIPKAKGFVWVVTQLDQEGTTIGKNYGRSAPAVFYQTSK
ncbi:MAG: hypothetical protein Q8916_02415 [Bacteroidota bacterium]|nr:hypothetical protein [Bacteroidota bacterium]MDP4229240.1 hypothetical protein [Bacteroidota bacterium]MDP4235544.1 hypothetical protein [Bacteroidota bacterium]